MATDEKRKLMISGSRDASPVMIDYTYRVVRRVIEYQWQIIVGDNHQGVDNEVVRACNELGYTDVVVVGIANKPRNGGVHGGKYVRTGKNYTERDRAMVDMCDRLMAIWNGESQGTMNAYGYAKWLDKIVDLKTFYEVLDNDR